MKIFKILTHLHIYTVYIVQYWYILIYGIYGTTSYTSYENDLEYIELSNTT